MDSRGRTTVLAASGFIDGLTAPGYTEHIDSALATEPATLILDLTGVDFLASAGLEALVRAREAGGDVTTVVVVADGSATRRPIEITGVDQSVTLYGSLAEAIADVDS
jgi:anti-sigma B factor antagonist